MENTPLVEHAKHQALFFFGEHKTISQSTAHSSLNNPTIHTCCSVRRRFHGLNFISASSYALLTLHKTARSPFNRRVNYTNTVFWKPAEVQHIVGSYLHFLLLLWDFTNLINHRKVPQSVNITELQAGHTPTSVTKCLSTCTGLYITLSSFHTHFDHSDARFGHLCRRCSAKIKRVFLFYYSRGEGAREIQVFRFTQIVFERSRMFLHFCALSLLAWPKCHAVVHLDSDKLTSEQVKGTTAGQTSKGMMLFLIL